MSGSETIRAAERKREAERARQAAAKVTHGLRSLELPDLIRRKLNDLGRKATAQGYPCTVDEALDPLSPDELRAVNSLAWLS